ncbi:hypothetical protein VPH35_123553 [Triticum aestivum]
MPPPTQTSTVQDPYYSSFMQNVIFEGRGEAFHVDGQEQPFDVDATQSQDGRGTYDDSQFGVYDDADEDNHGNSWHEDDDLYCEDEEDEVYIFAEPLCFIDELTQKAEAQKRSKSIRTGSYSQAENTLICESWKEDPIKGAEQKGVVFWTIVHMNFHERKKFPLPIHKHSRHQFNPKRCGFIQEECNKYCAALESIKARSVSGLGLGDLTFQSSEGFKPRHKDKSFTLTHCWVLIKDRPKFKDQYNARRKKRGEKAAAAEADAGDVLKRPRGKTSSKSDEKRDASSMALQGTLEDMMSQKKMRDQRKSKGREEQMKIYLDLQTKKLDMKEAVKKRKLDIEDAAQLKKLEIEATNADTKAKEVALAIMIVDKNNMSPKRKTWFTNRQKEMFARDNKI